MLFSYSSEQKEPGCSLKTPLKSHLLLECVHVLFYFQRVIFALSDAVM